MGQRSEPFQQTDAGGSMTESVKFHDDKVVLFKGDCLEALKEILDNSIDACVTDPPYHLTEMTQRYGNPDAKPCGAGIDGSFRRLSKGFMGKAWDGGDIAFQVDLWREVFRVLKPGAHLLAFGGTRTYHRMVCAIEDAGFEIRDQIQWVYGTGFPKSLSVSKAIDKAAGAEREVVGFDESKARPNKENFAKRTDRQPTAGAADGWKDNGATITAAATDAAKQWDGWGTALKPANEPICLARKPLEGTVAENVLRHGTGALNIDGCRVATSENPSAARRAGKAPEREAGTWSNDRRSAETFAEERPGETLGRFPANLLHDGSQEVVALFPNARSGEYPENRAGMGFHGGAVGTKAERVVIDAGGSAARFFYSVKASKLDRLGSKHPTVKPVDLIQYLVRLITPPGGLVLDPFAGTGTTGEAALREGARAVLVEREPEYQADIERRMALVGTSTSTRKVESVKAKAKTEDDIGPLFSGKAAA
jgi:DNA modification methylase